MLKATEPQPRPVTDHNGTTGTQEITQTVVATAAQQGFDPDRLQGPQALIDEFSLEAKRRKRLILITLSVAGISMVPLFVLALFMVFLLNSYWLAVTCLALPFLTAGQYILWLTVNSPVSAKQEMVVANPTLKHDMRAVCPLLGGLGTKNYAQRRVAVNALVSLLPLLRETDASWLSERDEQGLLSVLKWGTTPMAVKYYGADSESLVITAIRALSEVGDGRALGQVEALATGGATTDDRKRIQQAAVECLIPLRKRVERDRVGQHLLRSSARPESGEELLIPAECTPDANVSELPRPSDVK